VNKFKIKFFLIFFIFSACSLDNKSGVWTDIKKIDKKEEIKIKRLFKDEKVLNKEFNKNFKVNLKNNFQTDTLKANYHNNLGRYNYDKPLDKISKFKFSKIKNFHQNDPEIIFDRTDIIFFDDKGSVIKFDKFSKVKWKKNYYTKIEKKSHPFLFLQKYKQTLIVADSISKYYAINIDNGSLLWSKNNSSSFNSQIKVDKGKFYVVDYQNILHCYSIKDGKEIWSYKTENTLLKSMQKMSIVLDNDTVYFSNSVGDITAVNSNTGKLIWQLPTQNNQMYANSFLLKNSYLVLHKNSIIFSNNKNEFYSINKNNGFLEWKQKINSNSRSIIINGIIFSISLEGYLFLIDAKSGNILRATDLFNVFKIKKRIKIYPVDFVIGLKNIYLTTNNGKLLIIDIKSGKTQEVIKIDNKKVSKPFISNNNIYIAKDNSIIRFN
jgi:outer membrane protein assembly factor BamB